MIGRYFVHNGTLKDIAQAQVSLGDINYAYGYGVYESLKIRKGHMFFCQQHVARLWHSAEIIGIAHRFERARVAQWLQQLVTKNQVEDANLKVMLIGGSGNRGEDANLYAILLNPLFPPRNLYRQGVATITWRGERLYPQAKSLNMLSSTLAYRQARAAGAYDALMVNQRGQVTEGTRSNLFATDGSVIYTPPAAETLAGVTKSTVMQTIAELGIGIKERSLPMAELHNWRGLFLTSTSSKVMPIGRVDERHFAIPELVRTVMQSYEAFLKDWLNNTQETDRQTEIERAVTDTSP